MWENSGKLTENENEGFGGYGIALGDAASIQQREAEAGKMSGISLRDPQVLAALAAAGLCAGGAVAWMRMRKRPTEEELERQRRQYLVKVGRIIDGTILDTSEVEPGEDEQSEGLHLILYKYEIAGVSYECSQDVTYLKDQVDIHDCRLSFPCSVRYDPRQPGNSIVVAENWTGLRDTANSVPIHPLTRGPATPLPSLPN